LNTAYKEEDALEMAELVNGIVKSLLNGMDYEQKRRVEGWLDKELIDVPSWRKKSKWHYHSHNNFSANKTRTENL
jgi:hypothetical protein